MLYSNATHVMTKMELTNYLAEKMLRKAHTEMKQMVVAWGTQYQATHRDVTHLSSQQEEANTKLLLHAVDATVCGASTILSLIHISEPTDLSTSRMPSSA